jgi:exonuclease SbcD
VRFIHTADWHLGRIFYGVGLTDDQAVVLTQFCDLARDLKPDAIVISGDVYDRAFPPPEAVALLDETLTRLVSECRVPVIVIAGNHDSPERLGFASRVLERSGLHLVGPLTAEPVSVLVPAPDAPVRFWAIPYADPPVVADVLEDDSLHGHEAAMAAVLARVRGGALSGGPAAGERAVLVAHAFVVGGEASDSERPLSVGGTGQVPLEHFGGFSYVALGHLHRPQAVGSERVRYAGSLLKYSFAESEHRKSVSLVELGQNGTVRVEEYALQPRRGVRRLRGTLAELLAPPPLSERDDYVSVELTDRTLVYNPLERLRVVYPNVMCASRAESERPEGASSAPRAEDLVGLGMAELFGMFYEHALGEPLAGADASAFAELAQAFERSGREA